MARPQKEIDKEQFEKLCGLQCTKGEIASFFDVSEDTVDRWCKRVYKRSFAVIFAIKRDKGKISLRRSQFKLSERDAKMAIWLGKQYLNQKDGADTSEQVLAHLDEVLKKMGGVGNDA